MCPLTLDTVLRCYSTYPERTDIMPPPSSRLGFLSLPLKARLRIYELLLVREQQAIPHCKPSFAPPAMPAILRTCKQVHKEASRVLYAENTFLVSNPKRILEWLTKIGRANIELLHRIRIFVDPVYSTEKNLFSGGEALFWYKLLDKLARVATGLRHVWIYWDTYEWPHLGAGKDLRFVRELAKIQGLQSMVIDGCYGAHWPSFLSEKMGVLVEEKTRDLSGSGWLKEYQMGTENLVP